MSKSKLLTRAGYIRMRLVRECPFLGHLLLQLKLVEARPEHNVPIAGVTPDGLCYLNGEFLKSVSDEEFAFILCHEVMHLALLCWQRQQGRNLVVKTPDNQRITLWNIAHDYSFNGLIDEFGRQMSNSVLTMPDYVLFDKKFHGKSAEEIYDILASRMNDESCDAASIELNVGDKSLADASDLRGDLAESADGKAAAAGDVAAQRRLENEWKGNVLSAALNHEMTKGQGSLPAGIKKYIEELVTPRIDWQEALARWIGENGRLQDYNFRRPARRSESAGVYLPSAQRYGFERVCVLWDTSGSMNGREKEILGDINSLCEDLGLELRIIIIDAEIHADLHNVRDALDIIPEVSGGGGSDFCPAFDLLDREGYQGIVVAFTDGYISVPQTKPPSIRAVMWALTSHDADPTHGQWGSVLRVESSSDCA